MMRYTFLIYLLSRLIQYNSCPPGMQLLNWKMFIFVLVKFDVLTNIALKYKRQNKIDRIKEEIYNHS